jgi:hypothetical protein
MVPDHQQLLREIFGEKADEAQPMVLRTVGRKAAEGGKELLWYEINQEHVQGVVFCHHYEEWILTWNVSRGGLLGRYYRIPRRPVKRCFNQRQAVAPKHFLSSLDDFMKSMPVEVGGEISEDRINIHCPWRRSDAAAACDVVTLLSRYSDGLEACDDMGVWPDKDFTKWVNFANKHTEVLGTAPLHPDPTDALESDERDLRKSDDKD